jgi:hypothetical protein
VLALFDLLVQLYEEQQPKLRVHGQRHRARLAGIGDGRSVFGPTAGNDALLIEANRLPSGPMVAHPVKALVAHPPNGGCGPP